MAVNRDLKELLSTLNAFHVRFLVVGAHAVIHYTEPRYTKDLDIWVEPTAVNAQATWNALAKFGAPLRDVRPADFEDTEIIYQVGIEPNRVDIMPGVPGVRFRSAWRNAAKMNYGGEPIRILGFNEIVRAKRASARPQDLLDLAALNAARKRRRR